MKRSLMILILVAAAAFGMYAACRYYQDEYVPVSAGTSEIFVSALEEMTQISDIPDVLDIYEDSDIYVELPERIPVTENPLEKGQSFNSDMIGWIFIPGTDIDYPIVQCNNNDFYLNHGLDKQYNQLGVPFMDYQCNADFSGFNSIVYAHNMEWVLLFAEIYQFKTPSFLKSHSYGWLTAGDAIHRVDFFSYMTVPDASDAYETIFITDDNKKDYLEYLRTHSIYRYNAPSEEELLESHLLLLSTCTFEYDNARGILVGIIR